jgi:hypothetical protein
MTGKDVVCHIKLRVNETGGEAEAEVVAITPRTVVVKIDPTTPWDADALQRLSVALDVVAKTLPFKPSQE